MVIRNPVHSRYHPLRGGNRLNDVEIDGSRMRTSLVEACLSASLSASLTQKTEMKFTFADDDDATLFRSGIFRDGHILKYVHWRGRIEGGGRLRSGAGGPRVEVTAPSLFVHKLENATGSRDWGNVQSTFWFRREAEAVGMRHDIQPDLGMQKIVRKKAEGDDPESTWDVMVEVAEKAGAWIGEHSSRLLVGKPEWLYSRPWRTRSHIPIRWSGWSDYSDSMDGMPEFTPGAPADQELVVSLITEDADRSCPGDSLHLSGNLNGGTREMNANGAWLVRDVDIPLNRTQPVKLTCVRPVKGAL